MGQACNKARVARGSRRRRRARSCVPEPTLAGTQGQSRIHKARPIERQCQSNDSVDDSVKRWDGAAHAGTKDRIGYTNRKTAGVKREIVERWVLKRDRTAYAQQRV